MKDLLGPYTQLLNMRYGWDGPVFRGRFRNQVVSESEHLRVLLPYIHLNPVRARLAMTPDQALWTSYEAYTGQVPKPDWLTTGTVLSLYEGVDNLIAETLGYHTGELKWPSNFDLERGIFQAWSPEIPRTPAQKLAWKERQLQTVRYVHWVITDQPWEVVTVRGVGRKSNPARRFAAWLFATRTDFTHKEIGVEIGGNSNQVATLLNRLRKGRHGDPLEVWMLRADTWMEEVGPEAVGGDEKAKTENRKGLTPPLP